ncbi:MAG: hypothetical protein QOC87_1451, partial [Actinomycetota bacterium]|nr:hypothetical protein [Actinomycetota bacterium]
QIHEHVHDPQRLEVVAEPRVESSNDLFTEVPEGSVTQIMPEADGLGQILIESKCPGDRPCHLGDFESVREPYSVVVSLGGQEHLRLMPKAAERFAVDDAVAVSLVRGS